MGVSNRQKVQFNLGRKVMQYVITLTLDDRVLIDMVGLESYMLLLLLHPPFGISLALPVEHRKPACICFCFLYSSYPTEGTKPEGRIHVDVCRCMYVGNTLALWYKLW